MGWAVSNICIAIFLGIDLAMATAGVEQNKPTLTLKNKRRFKSLEIDILQYSNVNASCAYQILECLKKKGVYLISPHIFLFSLAQISYSVDES